MDVFYQLYNQLYTVETFYVWNTLYGYTIIANLTILAIAVAVFVFGSSIHGGALRLAAEEEERIVSRRKEKAEELKSQISKVISKVTEKMIGIVTGGENESDDNNDTKQLVGKIKELDKEIKKYDKRLSKVRGDKEALTLDKMILLPAGMLITSSLLCGIAIIDLVNKSFILWLIALILTVIACWRIYRNLRALEGFSRELSPWPMLAQELGQRIDKVEQRVLEATKVKPAEKEVAEVDTMKEDMT